MIFRGQLNSALQYANSLERRFDLYVEKPYLDKPIGIRSEPTLERTHQLSRFSAVTECVHSHWQRKNVLSENLVVDRCGRSPKGGFKSLHRNLRIRFAEPLFSLEGVFTH